MSQTDADYHGDAIDSGPPLHGSGLGSPPMIPARGLRVACDPGRFAAMVRLFIWDEAFPRPRRIPVARRERRPVPSESMHPLPSRRARRAAARVASALAAGLLAQHASPALAQYNLWEQEIGYAALDAEPGALATGAGVPVTLVETTDSSGHYRPDTTGVEFGGKTFHFRSADTGGTSSHANNVARLFFGGRVAGVFNQRSLAPGVTSIDVYRATHWLDTGYLRTASQDPPPPSPNLSRVASHAYLPGTVNNQLRRLDFLVDTDDYIQVVASTGGSGAVTGIGASFNGIAVGQANGLNAQDGTAGPLNGYPTGRHKPDLVATHGTSDSIGIIAGAAAMLIDLGSDPALSNGSHASPRAPGRTLQHAQTSEVVKAALMAGAARSVTNAPWSNAPITDYRAAPAHQAANGLDTRFGAGRLNIQNSYHVIAGGEHDSAQDSAAGPTAGHVPATGFDYDPAFGGANNTNSAATYRFATAPGGGTLTATLAWNARVTYDASSFDLTADVTLNAIALELFEVDAGGALTPVASSASPIDNTQSLWLGLTGGRDYALRVSPIGGASFTQDYALAWRVDGWAAASVPEPASAAALGAGVLLATRRRARALTSSAHGVRGSAPAAPAASPFAPAAASPAPSHP